mgnify:CR=1 FL=1
MQQAQGRDEGAVAALEEHELALRVEDELDVVLAFAYDRVALLRQQVLYVRLECRVPACERAGSLAPRPAGARAQGGSGS